MYCSLYFSITVRIKSWDPQMHKPVKYTNTLLHFIKGILCFKYLPFYLGSIFNR